MTDSQRKTPSQDIGPLRIRPGPVEILEIVYRRPELLEAGAEGPTSPDDVRFTFEAARIAPHHVGVLLGVEAGNPEAGLVSVVAACSIEVIVRDGVKVDYESEIARVASQIGPVVIFPYVREVIADVTRRGGKAPITLPVFQVGTFFNVESESLKLEEEKPQGPTKKAGGKAAGKTNSPAKKSKRSSGPKA